MHIYVYCIFVSAHACVCLRACVHACACVRVRACACISVSAEMPYVYIGCFGVGDSTNDVGHSRDFPCCLFPFTQKLLISQSAD